MLKNFIFGYSLANNIPPDNPFYGYLQWHNLCYMIYDARRYFWMIAFIMAVVFLVSTIFVFGFITIYIEYERIHGRTYIRPEELYVGTSRRMIR